MAQARFLAALVLALTLAPLPAARADEKAPQLSLEDVFGGGRSFAQGIPDWSWRPGHAELVRTDRRGGGAVLQTMDPESGKTADLLALGGLRELVPGQGTSMRGIGRSGAPSFQWREDGKALCAVVKGDLVWADLETGVKRRLTETDAPMRDLNVSPDGAYVSFSKAGELWVVATKEGRPYPLTTGGSETLLNGTLDWVYPEELGHTTAAWFSPDSKSIAYLQMDQSEVPRYRVPSILELRAQGREMFYPKAGDPNPKVRVGVVPVAGGETRWLPLPKGAEYVLQVSWKTDDEGRHVPFVLWCDRAQQTMWIDVEGWPLGGMKTHSGWLGNQLGGRWIYPQGRLARWKPDATRWFIQDWSASDPVHHHRDVTPKGVDAEAILYVEPQSGAVLYSGVVHGEVTQGVFVGGPGTEGIQRAPFAKDPAKWTSAEVDPTGTYALVTTSDAVTPPKTVLARVKNGEVLRAIGDAHTDKLDALKLAVPEYGSIPVEGMRGKIQWRLWKPHDFDPKKRYGLIVQVYGGPDSNMVRNTWGRGPLMQTMLCDKGYLVLQADGRGTGGQGAEWLYAVQGKLGVLETDDQAAAVQEILKRGYVDPKRVGIWGWSFGGTMACNALTMRPDVFQCGVAVASVTDWKLYDTIYTERYMGLPKDNPQGYEASSSITHAKNLTGHLLLMHGLSDDNVHVQNTLRLQEAFLQAHKTTYDVMLYPKRGHGIGGASLDVFRRLLEWFDRWIGP